jgi:hypothetical protein
VHLAILDLACRSEKKGEEESGRAGGRGASECVWREVEAAVSGWGPKGEAEAAAAAAVVVEAAAAKAKERRRRR